jgi:hypothetical protein
MPFFGSFLWQDKKEQKRKNGAAPLGISGKEKTRSPLD